MDTFKDKITFDRMEGQRQVPVDGLEDLSRTQYDVASLA